MNKLKELQYKCSSVELKWNNEQWEIIARLPDGSGCYCEGHDVAKVVAEALNRIEHELIGHKLLARSGNFYCRVADNAKVPA